MTPAQNQCLDFIRDYTLKHGDSPSYSAIAAQLGISYKAGAFRLVDSLIRDGRLIKRPALAIVDIDAESTVDRVCEALLSAFQLYDGECVMVVTEAENLRPLIARVLG